ncbi:MAG: hypothetical protein AAFY91_07655 [Bacteroidota bacterium]
MLRFFTATIAIFAVTSAIQAAHFNVDEPCVGLNCPVVVSFANQPLHIDLMLDQQSSLNTLSLHAEQVPTQAFQFSQTSEADVANLLNLKTHLATADSGLNLQLNRIQPRSSSTQPTYLSRQTATINLGFQYSLQ